MEVDHVVVELYLVFILQKEFTDRSKHVCLPCPKKQDCKEPGQVGKRNEMVLSEPVCWFCVLRWTW